MSDNRCVCCGAIIPEGSQVCPTCEKKVNTHKETAEEKFDRILNDWVYPFLLIAFIVIVILYIRKG